ncbi:hypothetical protein FACS1894166_10160 [Bacilli bacterium]|nr:hypothetical protein FACS1894166_10160 [Bacilli bacterium]
MVGLKEYNKPHFVVFINDDDLEEPRPAVIEKIKENVKKYHPNVTNVEVKSHNDLNDWLKQAHYQNKELTFDSYNGAEYDYPMLRFMVNEKSCAAVYDLNK